MFGGTHACTYVVYFVVNSLYPPLNSCMYSWQVSFSALPP